MTPIRSGSDAAPPALAALLGRLPAGVVARWMALAEADGLADALPPAEAAAVANAVHKRRREFAAGRACARAALVALGRPVDALPVGAHRAPAWPAGVVGSLSHDERWCVALAAEAGAAAGLGIDLERPARLQRSMAAMVCTAAERARFGLAAGEGDAAAGAAAAPPALARVFGLKEALFKALHPGSGSGWIGFEDAEVLALPDPGCGVARLRLLRAVGPWPAGWPVEGLSSLDGELVASAVVLPP